MCQNPWKVCKKHGCFVIIDFRGMREICKECWEEIADSELEWGNS